MYDSDFSTELYGGGPQHTHLPTKPEDVRRRFFARTCSDVA